MQLKRLCFDQPGGESETDGKLREKHQSRRRQCSTGVSRFIRRSLHKFLDSKWYGFCRKEANQFSGMLYHDTEGVRMSEEEEAGRANPNPKTFSYSELYIGSRGFSPEELLGSGGFGRVYRAVLPSDGTVVAVKCLAEKGEQFEKTFAAELVAVAHLRHRNLVKLRGWCIHDDQLLLVYDYMPNRSLDRLIFKKAEKSGFLDWDQRRKIVNGLAAALYYLHEQLETQIIHRDVKTSNVMLDSNFNARLGDFGLARWLEHKNEYRSNRTPSLDKNQDFRLVETTKIGGTIGYLPPESFQKRSYATAKSDVFSFGIVVLEVVSGRRAIDLTFPDDEIILLDWIRRLSDEKLLLEAADSRLLDGSYKLLELETMAKVGLLCTLHDPNSRPSMKWAVDVLSGNFYGKLPALPLFKTLPLYISLSSSPSDFTSSYTITTRTSTTTKSSTSFANVMLNSSNFITANGETLYLTAEMESENSSSSSSYTRKIHVRKSTFPVVETPRVITFQELISATNDFADSQRVAEVDFGTAYRGFLHDSEKNRHHVLVKRLGMKTCPALRVRFSNELQNVGRLRHRNLVQLRGWCTEQGEMLVVYDYSASHLLSHALFHHRNKIRWDHRYSIIRSLASAVHYLHEEWDEQVIHRSITSSAVLLDEELNPRLGSFALAEFLARNENGEHVIVDKKKSACGIFGYMAPEYMDCGEATTMADVYSFGVVVLEVVTGKMAVDFRWPEVLLVRKVHEFEEQKRGYHEFADRRLDGKYNARELRRLVKLGIACTSSKPESRPSMKQIVSILDGYDQWLVDNVQKEEKIDEWKLVNASSLSLIRRIQALGIQ